MSFGTTNRNAENDSLEMETYPTLDAGVYRARLETINNQTTKYGEALRFEWRVIGGDSDGETFNDLVNRKLMPKSKLATWAKAHLGLNAFPEGFVLKLSTLIGKEVHVTLSTEARNDGLGERNKVEAVSPFKPTTKKAKPEPPQQPPQSSAFSDAMEDEIPDSDYPPRAKEQRIEA